jgi:uncharacterized protein
LNKTLILAVATMMALFFAAQIAERHQAVESCACDQAITKISAIQGSGEKSPLVGKTVTVSAVVTGDYQAVGELDGFFVQEEDHDADSDPNTSEGIFVYDNAVDHDVRVGDLVCVTGAVAEYKGLTEIKNVSQVAVCKTAALPRAVAVSLPMSDTSDFESVEGMRVVFTQTLTVSDTYGLGRYGEVTLSNGRLFSPTEGAAPGAPAQAAMRANVLNRILLDDGSSGQNPDHIIYPTPGLSAVNPLRCGDTVHDLRGIMTYSYDSYCIEPCLGTSSPEFIRTNPRPTSPPTVGGSLRVATINADNYFNGDGCGGGFPTTRGAAKLVDFERQRDKLIKVLVGLDADIIGIAEIENDGYGPTSAIHDLVSGMNAAAPVGTSYAYIDPVVAMGTDEITVGLVYRLQTVSPKGDAAALPMGELPELSRPPLAQTFVDRQSGAELTVVVDHLKSKSTSSAHGPDRDQGEGQGCWNRNRTEAATALMTWLETDPTGAHSANVLIIGDLNSYTYEDPIAVIASDGYTDLIPHFSERPSYTYIYQGESGALDHALASSALLPHVTGAAVWHIDADEAAALGYTSAYKSSEQVESLYRNDPYRASDHDPIVIGLDLE